MSFWRRTKNISPWTTQQKGRARQGRVERVGRTVMKIANLGLDDRTPGEVMDSIRRRGHESSKKNRHTPSSRQATQRNAKVKVRHR